MLEVPPAPDPQPFDTRHRLLNAAGEVFAERGFRDATVREICGRAAANVAAVNYHFGDKDGLYSAVLRYAHSCAAEQQAEVMGVGVGGGGEEWQMASPEERLGLFVRGMLSKLFDSGRPAWHVRLMSREIVEPTAALDGLVRDEIRPMSEMLSAVVRDLLGPAATGEAGEELVRRCRYSVVGQCLFYHHARPVIERLEAGCVGAGGGRRIGDPSDPEEIAALAGHIATFSLGAILVLRAEALARGSVLGGGAGRGSGGDGR